MGGSSGGSFTPSDQSRLQAAAEQRLRAIASSSSKVLFACENDDRASLEALIERTPAFPSKRVLIIDALEAADLDTKLAQASFVAVFTSETTQTKFLDKVVDAALLSKIAGVHVQARPQALIPSKITAYRWRSMSWNELVALFQ